MKIEDKIDELEKKGYTFLFWSKLMDVYYIHLFKKNQYIIGLLYAGTYSYAEHEKRDDETILSNLAHAMREDLEYYVNPFILEK